MWIDLRWMPQNTFDDKSVLVQVIACCHWATIITWANADPNLCHHKSTGPQWVKLKSSSSQLQSNKHSKILSKLHSQLNILNCCPKNSYMIVKITEALLSNSRKITISTDLCFGQDFGENSSIAMPPLSCEILIIVEYPAWWSCFFPCRSIHHETLLVLTQAVQERAYSIKFSRDHAYYPLRPLFISVFPS